jgi:hypothetical protein
MPKASSNPTQRPRKRAAQPVAETRSGREALERALAAAVIVFGAITVLGFAATLLHVAFRDANDFFAGVAWQYAFWLPLVALPIMIVLVVVLVIMSARDKARTHRA